MIRQPITDKELKPSVFLHNSFKNHYRLIFGVYDIDEFFFNNCLFNNVVITLNVIAKLSISGEGGTISILRKDDTIKFNVNSVKNFKLSLNDFKGGYNHVIEFFGINTNDEISISAENVSLRVYKSKFKLFQCYANTFEDISIGDKSSFKRLDFLGKSDTDKAIIKNFYSVSTVNNEINFENIEISKEFHFNNSYIETLNIRKCILGIKALILNTKKVNEIKTLYVKNVFLIDNIYKENLFIASDKKRKFNIIHIKINPKSEKNLTIFEVKLDTLILHGMDSNSLIEFTDIQLNNFVISGFSTYKRVLVDRLYPIANKLRIVIKYSKLNNFDLFNIDLLNKSTLHIENSVLSGFNSINVTWPKEINVGNKLEIRSTYLQLKNAMLAQNNKIQALRFEALEMEAYSKELKESKGRYAEKWIMRLSWTNTYGQDFGKALAIYLILAVLILAPLFSFSATCIGFWSDSFNRSSNDYWAALGAAINPTHSFSDLCETLDVKNPSGWLIILDVFIRIIAAFFYFQIISAFRKYAKG